MSMMVGITKIKYLDPLEDQAQKYLSWLLDNEPGDCWVIRDQGHSLLEIGIEELKRLAETWQEEEEKTAEDLAEAKEWAKELETAAAGQDPVMLHISV